MSRVHEEIERRATHRFNIGWWVGLVSGFLAGAVSAHMGTKAHYEKKLEKQEKATPQLEVKKEDR